jgi:hypothetical protein
MTQPGGFTAGDVLTAADMNLLPAGVVAQVKRTSSQADVAAGADLTGLSVTFTGVAGRLYRVTLTVPFVTDTNHTLASLQLLVGAAVLQKSQAPLISTAGTRLTLVHTGSWTGSTTLKGLGTRVGAGGTVVPTMAADEYGLLLVEDIGLAP